MPPHDDDDPDFAPMPMPPGAGSPPAAAQAAMEAAEWHASNRLDRLFGSKGQMRLGTLYRSRAGQDCRARRILLPLTAKPDRGKFDQGDTAHVVPLTASPLDDTAGSVALCGAYMPVGSRWSGIRAFGTCHRCRMLSTPQQPAITGWRHKKAEKNWVGVKEDLCLPREYLATSPWE